MPIHAELDALDIALVGFTTPEFEGGQPDLHKDRPLKSRLSEIWFTTPSSVPLPDSLLNEDLEVINLVARRASKLCITIDAVPFEESRAESQALSEKLENITIQKRVAIGKASRRPAPLSLNSTARIRTLTRSPATPFSKTSSPRSSVFNVQWF